MISFDLIGEVEIKVRQRVYWFLHDRPSRVLSVQDVEGKIETCYILALNVGTAPPLKYRQLSFIAPLTIVKMVCVN